MAHKNIFKITALIAPLALAACGGGGSEGYYNQGSNGSNNGGSGGDGNQSETDITQVPDSLSVTIQNVDGQTIQIVQDNSQVRVAIKVLNSDKGGIVSKDVRLSIVDADNIGVQSTSSKVTSDENGVAIFNLNIPTLQTETGKVQLTAIVEGTTISIPYTLNIQKTTTITSDYSLSIPQGLLLNLPSGNVNIPVVVTDTKGGVKSGQIVELSLPDTMKGKFTSSSSSITTDAAGKANFTITANNNLSAAEITALVNSSQTLTFKLIDENKAEKQEVTSLTFKDISTVVNNLEIVKPDAAITAQGGKALIKVYAKNSNGDILVGKKVKLVSDAVAYGVKLNLSEAVTNAEGFAEFELASDSSYPIALSQRGIKLTANYLVGNENSEATATVQVITSDESIDNKEAIQRLEIASSYRINATKDQIAITVKAINFSGVGANKGKVTLSLNQEASSNGVTFEGAATKDVSNEGFVTFILKTANIQTPSSIAALVSAGITATFATDNNVSNSIKITVEDEVASEEALRYLAFEPILERFDYTQSHTIKVRVQAIGEKDSALRGEHLTLARIGLNTAQLADLGLTPKGGSSRTTDENGFAEFEFDYRYSGTQNQKDLLLSPTGVRLQAESANGKNQTIALYFKEPTAVGEVVLEALTIDTTGYQSLKLNETTTFTVTAKATSSNQGAAFPNQRIGLGINEVALQNGVSITDGASKTTNAQGLATFVLSVTPKTLAEIENLVANGLTLAIKSSDGLVGATRKVEFVKPTVILPNLANITITPENPTLSVLGGETRVKVVSRDANGNAIPNTPISIALSSLTSSRVSLSDLPTITNSKGEAEFTLTVSEGEYDASLIKNGAIFAVVGTNLNNGDRLQQTSSVGITAPANALNPRLTADVNKVAAGQTVKVFASVKDEMGINTAGGTPMRLSLNPEAISAGVKLSAEGVVIQANGNVAVDLIIPQGLSSATLSSIVVTGKIRNPNGAEIPTTLTFTVEDVVNPNHLVFSQISKTSVDVNGDRAIVTVQLRNHSNQPVANQDVTLAANNTAELIISTLGGGTPTNTSTPQTVRTDSNGNAFFAVDIAASGVRKDLLLASQIELTASNTSSNGVVTTQVLRIATVDNSTPPVTQAARYSVRIAAKPIMNVRDDTADVTVTLVDSNGGGVEGQYVTLGLDNIDRNGAIIVGASGKTTDANGQAVFKVRVDETARRNYTDVQFINDNLRLTAHFNEADRAEATQIFDIDIVQAAVQTPVASIVIGVNPTEVASSSDGVYYTKNLSVSVVDFNGNPLANQAVIMDVTPLTYIKGRNLWALAPVPQSQPEMKWVFANQPYYPNGIAVDDNGTPNDTSDDTPLPTIANSVQGCVANPSGAAIGVNQIPVKVVTFVSQSGNQQNTFTTDANGKFDFAMRYPKIYAQWLNVQIGASSTIASLPNRTTYNLGLAPLSSDYSSDGTYSPNEESPYGTDLTCP